MTTGRRRNKAVIQGLKSPCYHTASQVLRTGETSFFPRHNPVSMAVFVCPHINARPLVILVETLSSRRQIGVKDHIVNSICQPDGRVIRLDTIRLMHG
ncbi:hypothetical protein EHW66_04875 [Erwinia psidii]|nr:hypothetical protein [Erwinia psidii]